MSRAMELAEEEAARVEAEEAAQESAEPAEPEPEPEPEPQPSGISPEKQARELEREITRHAKAIERIMGEGFAALYVCEPCGGMGFTLEAPDAGPEYRQSESEERCAACDGWGDVLSGARVERGKLIMCLVCGGSGHRTKTQPASAPPAYAPSAPVYTPPMAAPASDGADQWGRGLGHPQWGIPPDSLGR